jgi:hypothetical protein
MLPSPTLSRSFQRIIRVGVGLGVIAAAGCGGSAKPKLEEGSTSTAHKVLPPPTLKDGKPVGIPPGGGIGKGTMSAREFRDYRRTQAGQP